MENFVKIPELWQLFNYYDHLFQRKIPIIFIGLGVLDPTGASNMTNGSKYFKKIKAPKL